MGAKSLVTVTDSGTERKLTGSLRKITNGLRSVLLTSVGWHSWEWMCVWMRERTICTCMMTMVVFVSIFVTTSFSWGGDFFVIKIKSYSSFSKSIVYTYYCGLDILGWPFKLSIATFVTILEFCTFACERNVWNSLIYFFKRFTICSTIRDFSELWIFSFVFFESFETWAKTAIGGQLQVDPWTLA